MVILHSILCGCFLNSCAEKKLAIALKAILVLEAIAKSIVIVKANLAAKRMPLHPCTLIYRHAYRYLQLLLPASLQTTLCARKSLLLLPLSISLIGMNTWRLILNDESLTVTQDYSTRIWCFIASVDYIQSQRIVEAQRVRRFPSCPCHYQRPGTLLCCVSLSYTKRKKANILLTERFFA